MNARLINLCAALFLLTGTLIDIALALWIVQLAGDIGKRWF